MLLNSIIANISGVLLGIALYKLQATVREQIRLRQNLRKLRNVIEMKRRILEMD